MCNLYAVIAVETPRAVPSLSKINLTGSGLRVARAIAKRKTHPSSASKLEVEVRLVGGIKLILTNNKVGFGVAGIAETQNTDVQIRHGEELGRRKDTMICVYGTAHKQNFISLVKR